MKTLKRGTIYFVARNEEEEEEGAWELSRCVCRGSIYGMKIRAHMLALRDTYERISESNDISIDCILFQERDRAN